MSKEIWRDVQGYEDYYQVSSMGRVKSIPRTVVYSNGKVFNYKEKIHEGWIDNGYRSVSFCKNCCTKNFQVHILIARAFLGERPKGKKGKHVRHKDSNPLNNHYKNLAYSSVKRNAKDRAGADTENYGERCGNSKLTFEIVNEIRTLKASSKITNQALSIKFKVFRNTISDVILGKSWTPEKYTTYVEELEKQGNIKAAKRIKKELKIIAPKVWVTWLENRK